MRPIWKGTISFGLVSIPIALYRATRYEEMKFRLLRKTDLSPVNYKRVAEADGKEVPWDQIVKGYEYESGKFIVLKEEDFQRVDLEATQTVDIIDFVQLDEINPMFFHRPYYMEPQKGADKAYVLLRDALKEAGQVGVAKVVIKTRQHLAAIKPQTTFLVLELMHFAEELIDCDELDAPASVKPSEKELQMARALIKSMTDKWDPDKYTDDYRDALLKLIRQKVEAGGKEISKKPKKTEKPGKIIDLVEVLQQSLHETQKTARRKAA
jgi:DNA end-binding protein Ku